MMSIVIEAYSIQANTAPAIIMVNRMFCFIFLVLCVRARPNDKLCAVMVKETIIIDDRLSLLNRGHYAALEWPWPVPMSPLLF